MPRNILLILFVLIISSCNEIKKPKFIEWQNSSSISMDTKYDTLTKTFISKALAVDTIYRSMQGPFEVKEIVLGDNEGEILWITGYKSSLINASTKAFVEDKFMCHNNLNYRDTSRIPWKLKTSGGNSRIFTLTQGQTNIELPSGFGIPVPSKQNFEMVSQVLNHTQKEIDIEINHQVEFNYIRTSIKDKTIKPLYQQSIFITKQLAGPAGPYGLPKLCIAHHLDSSKIDGDHPKHDCSTEFNSDKYDPYKDSEGRRYTGHWYIPHGEETLTTDVTPMLDLDEDSRVHYIGAHLHPLATNLELWDSTLESLIYDVEIIADTSFGFKKIGNYSSEEGFPIFASHKYELRSTYSNPDSLDMQTAMAVMYLYIADK